MTKRKSIIYQLEYIKDTAIQEQDIMDNYFIADIELVLTELCDFLTELENFDGELTNHELDLFIDYYSDKDMQIISAKDAEEIINLIFYDKY